MTILQDVVGIYLLTQHMKTHSYTPRQSTLRNRAGWLLHKMRKTDLPISTHCDMCSAPFTISAQVAKQNSLVMIDTAVYVDANPRFFKSA